MWRILWIVLFAFSSAVAQNQLQPPPHTITASAEATVRVKPDRAQISIGVLTEASTAAAAAAQNAEQSTNVLSSIRKSAGGKGLVTTSDYSIAPEYQYPQGGAPKLTGYQVSNTVRVTVEDLSLLGAILDGATQSGANQITGIAFLLKDDEGPRGQALAEAASKARSQAEAIAKALNLRVVGVLNAQVSEASRPRPIAFTPQAMAMKTATPVEAGTLDVQATVTVTLEVQ